MRLDIPARRAEARQVEEMYRRVRLTAGLGVTSPVKTDKPVDARVIADPVLSNVGSAITDLSGNYTFAGLVRGTYTVSASLDGYSFTGPLIVSLDEVPVEARGWVTGVAAPAFDACVPEAPS